MAEISGRLHCTSDGHNKWWAYTYDTISEELVTEWGSLDSNSTVGNQKTATPKEVEALVNSKLRKGYYEAPLAPATPAWADALDAADEEDYEIQDLVDWLSQQTEDFAQSLVMFYDDRGFLSPKQLEAARKMRMSAADPVTEPGTYRAADGVELTVVRAKTGDHFYAKIDGEFVPGGMKGLTGSMRINDLT